MALTADRNTPARDGNQIAVPVEAATKLFAGSLVCRNPAGNAIPAADTAGLIVLGMAEAQVDNSAGAAGAVTVSVRRRRTFKFANSGGSPLAATDVGADALVEDDGTVAKVSVNSVIAGKVIEVDATGVWVEIN